MFGAERLTAQFTWTRATACLLQSGSLCDTQGTNSYRDKFSFGSPKQLSEKCLCRLNLKFVKNSHTGNSDNQKPGALTDNQLTGIGGSVRGTGAL